MFRVTLRIYRSIPRSHHQCTQNGNMQRLRTYATYLNLALCTRPSNHSKNLFARMSFKIIQFVLKLIAEEKITAKLKKFIATDQMLPSTVPSHIPRMGKINARKNQCISRNESPFLIHVFKHFNTLLMSSALESRSQPFMNQSLHIMCILPNTQHISIIV